MKSILFLFGLFIMNFTFGQSTFSKDTLKIESTFTKELDNATSNSGTIKATSNYYNSYDKLLNDVYKKLISALKPTDKSNFISAQKQWILFRDIEFKNIELLYSSEDYFGGGTMTYSMIINARANIVKSRCVQINDLLGIIGH